MWRFEFTPNAPLAERGVNVSSIRARLQAVGEILHAAPRVAAGGTITFEFLVAGPSDAAVFAGWVDDGLTWALSEAPRAPEPTLPDIPLEPASDPARAPITVLVPTSVVRVDLSRLDALMQMVGDLVISRARLEENLRRLEPLLPAAECRTLQETNQALERQLRNLREGVMRVRLVPIGEAFARIQFIVRDLAGEQRKQIKLVLSGQETEIDKYLVERIMDPLLHLIRNAISHGLEPAEERLANGKPAAGQITLRAATAGEAVVLEVEDDGRGIDPVRVAAQAHALGLLDSPVALSGPALVDILCMPGFTTCSQADRVSGRGVGMDVVQNAVQELGGTLLLDSLLGRGTRFTIHLPLTLAIADALIARVGDQTFAVPQAVVQEVLPLEPGRVTQLENNELVSHRGRVLPLVRLANVFGLSGLSAERPGYALVVGSGVSQVALAVDVILGLREIVVRGLTDPLVQVPGIVGATELGDGRVVLILDAPALIRAARQPLRNERRNSTEGRI